MPRCARCVSCLFVAFTLSLVTLFAAAAPAKVGLVATKPFAVGGVPYSTAIADFNHDGIPDVVVAAGSTNNGVGIYGIVVALGKGDGTFQTGLRLQTPHSVSFVCVADVNGDGNPDVITASFDPTSPNPGGEVGVMLGLGNGSFSGSVEYSIPNAYATAVYPADLNGDGHIDLVIATTAIGNSSAPLGMAVLMNNGSGTFVLGQVSSAGMPLAVGDVNKDGKLDAVLVQPQYAATGNPPLKLMIYAGAGNGTFTQLGGAYALGVVPYGTYAGVLTDLNGDGAPDIAMIDGASELTVLMNNGAGEFKVNTSAAVLDQNPTAILAGDFNHDGHMDIAVGGAGPFGSVDVLLGKGDGTLNFKSVYGTDGTGQGASSLSEGDLNGDGYLDLVSSNTSGTLSSLYGKPGGTFNAEVSYSLGDFQNSATIAADFNGDGITDLAVLNYGGGCPQCFGSVSIMLGKGNGLFVPLGVRYKTGTLGAAFAVGDVNGDGKLDLIVEGDGLPYNNYEYIGLLLGNGDGTFQAAKAEPNVCAVSGTPGIALADLNNDGKLDAMTLCGVSLGNGDGTFQKAVPLTSGANDSYGEQFALGDFNKDGKLDVAFVGSGVPASVTVLLGTGTGTFASTPAYTTTVNYGDYYRNWIAVGHFTSDGNLGVVIGAVEETTGLTMDPFGEFSILAGNGNGTLKEPANYLAPQDLLGFGVGDFNGDGIDDLAVLSEGSSNPTVYGESTLVSIYVSKGDGTLQTPTVFGAGGIAAYPPTLLPAHVSVADFNNDGAVDLAGNATDVGAGVLMNSNGNSVSLKSSGNVKAGQPVTFTASVAPSFHFTGAISGQVNFYDGKTLLGGETLAGGVATFSTSSLSAGTHSITAVYQGNTTFNQHGSNMLAEVVTP